MKTGVNVGDAMTENPVILHPDDDLKKCAKTMDEYKVSAVIIRENKEVKGIITEKDIVRRVVAEGKNPFDLKVKDIMNTNVTTVSPYADIFEAMLRMRDLKIRHLPVLSDGKMIGLLTLKDVLRIQPQLFELMADKIRIREEERKLVNRSQGKDGVCQICGEYADELAEFKGSLVCNSCRTNI